MTLLKKQMKTRLCCQQHFILDKFAISNIIELTDSTVGGADMNIRVYRERAAITQKQLADAAGIAQCYLSELEKGRKNNPNPVILLRLSRALNVTMEELMEDKAV